MDLTDFFLSHNDKDLLFISYCNSPSLILSVGTMAHVSLLKVRKLIRLVVGLKPVGVHTVV